MIGAAAAEVAGGSTGWEVAWLEPPAVIAPAVSPPAASIPKTHGVSGCMPSSFRRRVCNQHHVLRLAVDEGLMRVLLMTITTSHEGELAGQGPSVS